MWHSSFYDWSFSGAGREDCNILVTVEFQVPQAMAQAWLQRLHLYDQCLWLQESVH
uniref:Uncharacterized protein n=1 Tax=Rhizophora mucronata TaxID=61149 RepID=A0A2P2PQH0_RHIMU